jgi:hypothetical protein
MRLVFKLEDELITPMSPSIMIKDKSNVIYIIGGVVTEKYENIFGIMDV